MERIGLLCIWTYLHVLEKDRLGCRMNNTQRTRSCCRRSTRMNRRMFCRRRVLAVLY